MLHLNWVDYIFILIFLLSFLTGLSRGLVKEFISLMILIAAFALAITFANPLASYISTSESVQGAITQASSGSGVNAAQPISYVLIGLSFALIFATVTIIGTILSFFINMALNLGTLGIFNRLLGAIFGLVRGYIVVLVAIFVVQLTPLSTQYWWQQSQIVAGYQPAVHWLDDIVSPSLANMKDKIGNSINKVSGQVHSMLNRVRFF